MPLIELQDTLNRKTGPGKIGPETPMEVRLYGPDGQPLGTTNNPLAVKVQELEDKIDELKQTLTDGAAKVQLTGHIQEFAVSSWDELDPGDVPKGSLAQLIGTDDIRQTDGTEWVRI